MSTTGTSSAISSDTTVPGITNVYKNDIGTYFKVTANDNVGLGVITNSSGTLILKDISSLGTGGTCNVYTGLSGTTALRVYDGAENYKDVNSSTVSILTDTTPPTIKSVTYSNGNYIITAQDTESGLWEITDLDDNTLTGADYSI